MARTAKKSQKKDFKYAISNLKSQMPKRSAGLRVWHITDFDEIFKLADDKRKGRVGPLAYTKSFVSLSGNSKPCESHHLERLNALKARPERHLLRSVFEDVKNWSANKPQHHQGYLVTTEGRPANADYIAAQLDHILTEDIRKALPILGKLGLIERVALNGQFIEPEKEEKKDGDQEPEIPDSIETGEAASGGNDPAVSGNDRTISGNNPPEGKVSGTGKEKATIGLTADGTQEKENGKEQSSKSPEPMAQSPPAAPSSRKPKEADASGVSKSKKRLARSPGSDYSSSGLAYGRRLYLALGFCWDTESTEARREICSFASKHDQIYERLSNLTPPIIDKVFQRGLKEAKKIARRKSAKNKGSVINDLLDKFADAKL